jgi:mono/diheme cytochrome c family protein
MAAGKAIYDKTCQDCHQLDGTGIPGLYPPLAGNVNMNARPHDSVVHIILAGTKDPIAGEGMPGYPQLSDADVAAMSTYIRNSWGNNAPAVSEGDVKKLRRTLDKLGMLPKPAPAAPAEAAPAEAAPATDAAAAESAPAQ